MIEIEVQRMVDDPRVPDDQCFSSWAKAVLGQENSAVVNLRVVDEAESWALNREWRGKESATNVLSFPADMPLVDGMRVLGDVVLCAPVIEQEASEQGKSLDAHWAHLVIHGLLHLLGFDHINGEQARQMEAREIELLAGLGFSNPYETSHGI
ncbi:MAG: rRNA maturation RNase YbeY [Wenzhouxiangella sp.]|jgi:probable rRNA maturation factor|nr:rRNA maturation RNase YbeY [Wenzhouxiangella sp.]